MVFSSLTFLGLFLPLTLCAYYLSPRKAKNTVLLLASLLFYAWGEPRYALLMVLSILVNYALGLLIAGRKKKLWLVLSVLFNVGLLSVFKYTDLILSTVNELFGSRIDLLHLALPIGISFYTFQAMSYTIDVYRGKVPVQKNLLDFGAYIAMFPQLIAGPIVRYEDVAAQLKERSVTAEDFADGMLRFIIGLAKKVLLANQLGQLWDLTLQNPHPSALLCWMGAAAFTLQIYFDFSGYSDMAIGLGRLFGFRFPENFRYPYMAQSVTEFWRRWHITLGTWFREYLYIPLGGNRKGPVRQLCNLAVVWALTGLWHGADWNFLLWGLYYFVLLAAEKLFLLPALEKLPSAIRSLLTMAAVVFGWILFSCSTAQLPTFLAALFGKNGAIGEMDLYYLLKYAILAAIAILGCTDYPVKAAGKLHSFWPKAVGSILLLALCISVLIGDSYNPFLYFRF